MPVPSQRKSTALSWSQTNYSYTNNEAAQVLDNVEGSAAQNGPDDCEAKADRRRPGRPHDIDSSLVVIFRNTTNIVEPVSAEEPTDDLAAARGIALTLLLSIPIWAGIIGGVLRWTG